MGRYVADHIQGSRFVELDGSDTFPFVGDVDAVIAEVEEFVTGERTAPELDRRLLTLLFTDIVDSTKAASALGDSKWRQVLDDHDLMVHRQLERFGGTLVKSTGDGTFATFDGPARAVRCAGAILDAGKRLGLGIRAGLHTGECEVRGADLGGIAVHIAARIEALAGGGEVLVSGVIPPLVTGSSITFTDRGIHQLKGLPGTWNVFAVDG
jgi:class 3 adenylate cyclase